MQLKTIIIGASGYAGVELIKIIQRHPNFQLANIYVSTNSNDANKKITTIYPELKHIVDLSLLPLPTSTTELKQIAKDADLVFLATEHNVSHDLVPIFLENSAVVFDLSGAFRLNDAMNYTKYYNFEHQYPDLLKTAVYGLAEWNMDQLKNANLIAVPGCYPTVSLLSLKPLIMNDLLDLSQMPIINATSGVSGAGRKPKLTSSFCEVSLQAYGIFNHRHQVEIAQYLNQEVIFTPHLGNFKRGILATIVAKLKSPMDHATIYNTFMQYYAAQPLIRLYPENEFTNIKAVENSPFCDISFKTQDQYIILVGAEDNLLKGAAAQAVQCANIRFGLQQTIAIL